jgi:hypothetical protein
MKILAPNVEMPVINKENIESAKQYRIRQDYIINQLMGFDEEEREYKNKNEL